MTPLQRLAAGAAAVAALSVLALLGSMALSPMLYNASSGIKLARAVEWLVVAGVTVLLVAAADAAVDRGLPRAVVYVAAVVCGSLAGGLLGWEVRDALGLGSPPGDPAPSKTTIQLWAHRLDLAVVGMLVGGLVTFVHVSRRTAMAARRRQFEAEQARALARRRTLQSQLQALQARVEPMFLFDTLARIRALYRDNAAAGATMLEDLIAYLRAALPHLRESTSSVGQEVTLARSWLGIVTRATPGAGFAFEVPPELQALRMPALLLLPLVQCAAAAPGQLGVAATSDGDTLRFAIDARGDALLQAEQQALLTPLRERLRALYGDAAQLRVERAGSGSRALLTLPLERQDVDPPGEST